ncbi:MAG: DoxX [Mucilaginibacter sp.]|nr:DoxX [Mucilaginibacter sp.]
MNKLTNTGKWLYAVALTAFGIQHFIYADFLTAYVPVWIPWHLFFVYLVAVAFIATALSIVINKHVKLACTMLSIMLALFILLIHIPRLFADPQNVQNWTRALQDVVIMGAALVLTNDLRLLQVGKYLFAVPMIVLGLQHFTHVNFVTAKVPAYFPGIVIWDYLFGIIIVTATIGIISNRYLGAPAILLALFLLTAIALYQIPLLVSNIYDGQQWAGAMLELAIASGAFIVSKIHLSKYNKLNIATK